MKDFFMLIMGKIYTVAAIILGIIILIKRSDLINIDIPFIDIIGNKHKVRIEAKSDKKIGILPRKIVHFSRYLGFN